MFEVSFLERLGDTAPDSDLPTVLCGASAKSHEARMAAEKLVRSGYQDVSVLEGGIEGWKQAGLDTEGTTSAPAIPEPPNGTLDLDLSECRLEWTGRNLLNKHFGTIAITAGALDFDHGQLTGGRIEFDLQSLRCTDLGGDPLHDVLIRHLLDHDFLDAAEHPDCRLEITAAKELQDTAPGTPNLAVTAELTLRGITEPIEFTACSGLTPDGKPAAQASFAVDRTRWGILYGSARFFENLAGHLVNDMIEFQARIVTR
ncbi:YceI-like domain-containing protein [Haloferula helveola]|uniref:YceI-like domain-containing protein n=1 Tax=Haloferula helveola TaxID=490095 RepID=A0ABN6H554_9BACT|nr:YceI-like domain-containing protein [Haloferula helveola]